MRPLTKGPTMDFKKKLNDAKKKYQQHAPYIAVGIATVATVLLTAQNIKLKNQISSSCDYPAGETHVYVDDEAIRRLKEGQVAEFENIDDLRLVLHKDTLED
jgi:hypothetical protein